MSDQQRPAGAAPPPAKQAVGVVVISTGYPTATPADPAVQVIDYDYRPYAEPGHATSWGPPLRPDGTDSVADGSRGGRLCDVVAAALRESGLGGRSRVFSVKAGDSEHQLRGLDVFAVQPALGCVLGLAAAYPGWAWVAVLDWPLAAIGQAAPQLPNLVRAGVPLVVPVDDNPGLNEDMQSHLGRNLADVVRGDGVLAAVPVSEDGTPTAAAGGATVTLGLAAPDARTAAGMAAAWLAKALLSDPPPGGSQAAVDAVAALATPADPLRGKTVTGGLLRGFPK